MGKRIGSYWCLQLAVLLCMFLYVIFYKCGPTYQGLLHVRPEKQLKLLKGQIMQVPGHEHRTPSPNMPDMATVPLLGNTSAKVTCSLASYYSNHMVLQQQPHNAVIWGYADSKAVVEVRVNNKMYKANMTLESFSRSGVWKVKLDPMPAGGPYDIIILCKAFTGVNMLKLEDVMFGDVWVCSGQSNMGLTVSQSFKGAKELDKSLNYPNIRLLAVQQIESAEVLYDLKGFYEPWSVPSPETLGSRAKVYTYFSALCWFFGRDLYDSLKYPIGLISTNWAGASIQTWSSPDVLKACNRSENDIVPGPKKAPRIPYTLWNAMIHPLLNLTIKGVIWYQGEGNDWDPDPYKCLFPAMIDDWRMKWHEGTGGSTDPQFPFGFIQLCTSDRPSSEKIGQYPTLRWHQTYNYGYVPNPAMQNVFMAVSIDLPDPKSRYGPIHPRNKEELGIRLSLAGRAVAYGQRVKYAGPFPTSFNVNATALTVIVQYDKGQAQIKLVGKTGFEICCTASTHCQTNDTWVPANIIGKPTPSSIKLSYKCYKTKASAIRYLWRDMPCTLKNCPVYSIENNLPGPPFILNF